MNTAYAGFWKRCAAWLIDGVILGAGLCVIMLPFLIVSGIGIFGGSPGDYEPSDGLVVVAVLGYLLFAIVGTIGGWLYFALMESSAKQGTPGKLAMGIKVTDMSGGRITMGRATGRFFAKFISGLILCVGFVMAAFTQQKQALHDIIAGCLVVNRQSQS